MATFQAAQLPSPFLEPNELLNLQQLREAPQRAADAHENALLQRQVHQQTLGSNEIEYAARAAQGLLGLGDEAKMAAAYPGAVATAQQYGFLKNAPTVFPGKARLEQIAAMGTSSEKQYEQRGNLAGNAALLNGITGTTPGATTTASGAPALPIPARGTGGPGATAQMPPEYMDHFRRASAETGIPVDLLIAQARQESSFNPNARGAAGEIGIFQIKPSTAQQPGFGLTGVDPGTLTDPGANIMFGARYLKARMGQGDPNNPADQARALAAYNGGGDPNYVANVNRYRPGQSPTDPARAVTTYTPGGAPAAPGTPAPYRVATTGAIPPPPGAPPGTVAPAAAPEAPAAPGAPPAAPTATTGGYTPQQKAALAALAADPKTQRSQLVAAMAKYDDDNRATADAAYTRQRQAQEDALKHQDRLDRIAKEKADAEAAGRKEEAAAKGAQLEQEKFTFNQANTLRDEATKITETFRPMQEAYERLGEAAALKNAQGDLGLIYTYTRMLDPATVHEEEVKRGMNSGGYLAYIQGMVARVQNGELLTPDVRAQFLDAGRKFYDVRRKGYEKELDVYRGLAKKFNLDPDTVAVSVARDQPSAPDKRPPLSSFQR